jgi:hypothetical protein
MKTAVWLKYTTGAVALGGGMPMSLEATADTYSIPQPPDDGSETVAVRIDGEIRIMSRSAYENICDLRTIEEAKKEGPPTAYSEFIDQLDR